MGDMRMPQGAHLMLWLLLTLPALVILAGAGFVWWVVVGLRLVASGALENEGDDDD